MADQRVELDDYDPGWREYARLKDRLARLHPGNRNAYTNAKGDFVARALRRAGIDPPARDLLPE